MSPNASKQRLFASLLASGASILLFHTIMMLSQGALGVLVFWVSALLIMELLLDAACLLSSMRWWIGNDKNYADIPLRLGAAAAILHAVRVLVFVLGRIGPWIDFDVRPVQRALHPTRWNWGELYFAAVMSVLGLIGVLVIWTFRRRAKKSKIDNQSEVSHPF